MDIIGKGFQYGDRKEGKLTDEDENRLVDGVMKWHIDRVGEHKLEKNIKTETFRDAVTLLNEIADVAEKQDHHPDLHLYYNKLQVVLYTHKVGGLTEKDFIVAAKIDDLLEKKGLPF
jgi:4a-hydroxytetrahydrobiopterin dehydratase